MRFPLRVGQNLDHAKQSADGSGLFQPRRPRRAAAPSQHHRDFEWHGQYESRARKGSAGGRPLAFATESYTDRNIDERCINKLKQHRAVATSYDKCDYLYQGTWL